MARDKNDRTTDGRSWLYSLILHAVIIGAIFAGVGFGVSTMTKAPGAGAQPEPVKATVVSEDVIRQEQSKLAAREARRKAAKKQREKQRREEQQRLDRLKKQRQKAAEETKQAKAQAKAAREAAARRQRKADQAKQHLTDVKAQREAAAKAAAKAEKEAKAARKKADAAAAARKKAAEEKARRKEQAAKQAARRKQQLQEDLDAAAAAQKQAKKRNRALQHAKGVYDQGLRQAMFRSWNPPPSMQSNMQCKLVVTQVRGGTVVDVSIQSCVNAGDAVKQSIKSAAYGASPLPEPDDPSLFERKILVTFKPEKADTE